MTQPSRSNPLEKPVQYLKGVGPRRAQLLRRLGIATIWDLLAHFPRAYEDRRERTPIGRAYPGASRTLRGTVKGFHVAPVGPKLSMGKCLLGDGTGYISAVWFRRTSYRYDAFATLKKHLVEGTPVLVHGPIERNYNELQIRVEEFEVQGNGENPTIHVDRIVPFYDLTEGIEVRWLRELMWETLQSYLPSVADPLPTAFLQEHQLAALPWSLERIHFPAAWTDRDQARRRLAFEEFFFLELALALARERRREGPPAHSCHPTREHLTRFRQALGFDFTQAQKQVINEIFSDMAQPKPMSRLLQGDVGSGKTVVALSAMLLAVESGRQAALMAPTEILAEQHFLTLQRFLKDLPLRWALFTGSMPKKQRQEQAERVKSGEVHIAVGTHALIQEDVSFRNLGLAVIDEQHRFGVRQRADLLRKAAAPHVLVMTATPIPRTLAMTLYGDLAVSTIRELPPGRPPLSTHWTLEPNAWQAVRKAVDQGRQAYVVYPLVEESDKLDLRAAVREWERLKTQVFPTFKVGLLHGRMKPKEKEEAMAGFSRGEIQILVATPVIEVGIDVPNATVMVIMHAERFGLAQLHQLRGRVGRGRHPSSCYLVSSSKSQDPVRRLRLVCSTLDGFRLAEEDLKLRGPGEFLGEAQHGVPLFKIGDLLSDGPLIEEARRAAFRRIEADPRLEDPLNHPFLEQLKIRFAGRLFFGRVG